MAIPSPARRLQAGRSPFFDLGPEIELSKAGTEAKGIHFQDCRIKTGIDTKNMPYWHFLRIEINLEGRAGYQSGIENLRMSGRGNTLLYSSILNNSSAASPPTYGGVLASQGDTADRTGIRVHGNAIGNGHYSYYLQHRKQDGPMMVTHNVFFDGRPRPEGGAN